MERLLALIVLGAFVQVVPSDPKPQLRVLTYNIHHGQGTDGQFDYERLARVILSVSPDVVALQEVDRETGRSDGIDQAALLAKLTGMRSAFGRSFYYSGGEYGNALLSRFPLNEVQTHALPFRFGQEPRTALAAHVQPGDGLPDFILVSTHLETRARGGEQARQLNSLFADRAGLPVILAGDLNARTGSEPMTVLLEDHWVDASAPNRGIDFVLVRPADPWKVVDVEVVDDLVTSDHRPVLVVLEWTG